LIAEIFAEHRGRYGAPRVWVWVTPAWPAG